MVYFKDPTLQEVFPKREFCYGRERCHEPILGFYTFRSRTKGADAIKTVPHICLSGSKSNDPVNFPEQIPLGVVVDGAGHLLHDSTAAVDNVDVRHAFLAAESPDDGTTPIEHYGIGENAS